jgi:hypothetical protein
MRVPFFCVVLLCLLFVPVVAWEDFPSVGGEQIHNAYSQTDFTYDGSAAGERIISVKFDVENGARVDYTLSYGTTDSVSGYTTLIQEPGLEGAAGYYTSDITLNGVSDTSTFWNAPGITEARIATYWRNNSAGTTDGIIVYSTGDINHNVKFPVSGISGKLIYKIHITSTSPTNIEYVTAPQASVEKYITADSDLIGSIMAFASSAFWSAYDFLTNLVYWLKFFFIDNLGLIVTLYLAVTMAFAARSARGRPDRFLAKFIGNQVKLFRFMFELWRMLLESIGTIRGWFRI